MPTDLMKWGGGSDAGRACQRAIVVLEMHAPRYAGHSVAFNQGLTAQNIFGEIAIVVRSYVLQTASRR